MIYNEANDSGNSIRYSGLKAPVFKATQLFCVNSVRENADTESHVIVFKMLSVQTELQMFSDMICKNYLS